MVSVWTDCLADVPPNDPIADVDLVDVVDLLALWCLPVVPRNHRTSRNRLHCPDEIVLLDEEEVTILHHVVLEDWRLRIAASW